MQGQIRKKAINLKKTAALPLNHPAGGIMPAVNKFSIWKIKGSADYTDYADFAAKPHLQSAKSAKSADQSTNPLTKDR
jgi:hypothetical protein